jgi:hypothetical protein
MKAVLLFLMVACTASMCSIGNATTTDDANRQQKARPPLAPHGHRNATADKRTHKSAPLPKPPNPHRARNSSKGSVAGKAEMNGRRQMSEQRNNAANAGPASNRSTASARSIRPSSVSRTAVATPNNVRHHGADSAALGGPRSTTVASTAALSGRAMKRRP